MKLFQLSYFCLFFIPLSISAQTSIPEVVASGGDFYNAGTFTNAYTIGEMAQVETYTTTGFILTQGFQQPADLSIGINTSINSAQPVGIFPNPSDGIFFLEYSLENNADVVFEIFDALGQKVSSEESSRNAGTQLQQINLASYTSGIYSVRITITAQGISEMKSVRLNLIR